MRIQKYISQCGICSRREAETKILEGLVTVNGKPAEIGQDVNPETDRVWVDGRVARGAVKEKVVLAMNKPKGYLCSNSDPFEAQTVFDLLPEPYSKMKLFCCGRLDKGSRGLLILTNDGDLANKITHPSGGIIKRYRVLLNRDLDEKIIPALLRGVYSGVFAHIKMGRRGALGNVGGVVAGCGFIHHALGGRRVDIQKLMRAFQARKFWVGLRLSV